ncbi:hypothetical protein EG327_010576 [Venturia inaequalis]|uniref:Rhodopsin domain-containing protein n=1 Tax=Venturia inaequalis TaxID=5025 RepID=A0A8H3UHA2_VENIN|nr:hypothetical protein EG327_010576 [Venturia inaequalis]
MDGHCIARPPFYLLQAIAGGVTDLLLMITPIPTILGLQMSRKAKAGVIAWFGVGLITLAMSVMRLVSLLGQLHSSDIPWLMPEAMLWVAVESNLIIICGCLPTFRIFLRIGAQRKAKSSAASSGAGKNFGLQTFSQRDRRSRRRFDTIAEIDAIDDMDLKDNAKDYRATVSAYTAEGSDYNGSDGEIVRTFSVSAKTAGSSWNGSQEGIDRTTNFDTNTSGPLSSTRG